MNNLIDMSDYEKIIFVNGIDEQNANIRDLSKNYPFVVFFTNNEEAKSSLGYPVANIWKGIQFNDELVATRLTRFVGVDPERDTINIDGKSIKLKFDYNTGLIGFDTVSTESFFIYAGYIDPASSEFDINTVTPFTRSDVGNELWNWRNMTYVITGQIFYIAIPYEFKDTIKPRWEGYILNSTNEKKYQSCVNPNFSDNTCKGWFNINTDNLIINGIRFVVYKSKIEGVIHCKIQ